MKTSHIIAISILASAACLQAVAENKIEMAPGEMFTEEKLNLSITPGPFAPDWESIESNYPGEPAWLREAKFGIWVHFGPQSAGESGDWYARNLYKQGSRAYENHLSRYGHPSEYGYKEVLRDWNPDKFNPEMLTRIYKEAGARFLMIQGVHHDNYDLWDSKYHKWNSVNIGPHRDFLREWADACRREGMRYGVTFHHEYTWWWWQTAFGADSTGPKAGVPYDGNLTLEDGKGKWWEGYDPAELYGIDLRRYATVEERAATPWSPPADGIFHEHLDYSRKYAEQWARRMMDVTHNYDPDFIYTDGTVEGPFTGTGTGTGYKCNAMQTVMADYYNRTLRDRGEVNTFSIIKFRHPTNGAVNTAEFDFPDTINTSQPWIREAPVGDWFYAPGFIYDSGMMIRFIIEAIARDGNAALNICLMPDGSIEPDCVRMLREVGQWMALNGEGVYGSRAWISLGEGQTDEKGRLRKLPGGGLGRRHADFEFSTADIRYTVGKNGSLYAFCMTVPAPGETIVLKTLGNGSHKIKDVFLPAIGQRASWSLSGDGLKVTMPADMTWAHSAIMLKINLE